eukprot:scaffold149019_cov19-Tisochrysis_lutea.AAC.1
MIAPEQPPSASESKAASWSGTEKAHFLSEGQHEGLTHVHTRAFLRSLFDPEQQELNHKGRVSDKLSTNKEEVNVLAHHPVVLFAHRGEYDETKFQQASNQ